jgi:hypothetical protein
MADELSEQIDTELRAYLRSVDSYQVAQAEVEAGRAVSQLQYPARITPRARISFDTDRTDEGGVFQLQQESAQSTTLNDDTEHPGGGDPLRWFGVLVPQHLRATQKAFARGLESAVLAASAVVEMRQHFERYEALLAKKRAAAEPQN